MTCPACGSPVLFGAGECPCGWKALSADLPAIDLSYREALSAFWRVYWPMFLVGQAANFVLGLVLVALYGQASAIATLNDLPFLITWSESVLGVTLFLLIQRLVSKPYRKFALVVATGADDGRLNFRRRMHVWFYVFWRLAATTLR